MGTKQNNVRLDEATDARLAHLAARTGRTKSFYINEAIEGFLEDYEDYYLAKDALDEFRQSDDAAIDIDTIDLAEFDRA
jgi:RHH-type rel operon transcriptional repressor/antitoxin RelB